MLPLMHVEQENQAGAFVVNPPAASAGSVHYGLFCRDLSGPSCTHLIDLWTPAPLWAMCIYTCSIYKRVFLGKVVWGVKIPPRTEQYAAFCFRSRAYVRAKTRKMTWTRCMSTAWTILAHSGVSLCVLQEPGDKGRFICAVESHLANS